MVKPPKGMQPEGVDLKMAGRGSRKSPEEDKFRNYMARKIDLQRKQFGLVVPPPPEEIENIEERVQSSPLKKQSVQFAPGVRHPTRDRVGTKKRKRKRAGPESVRKKLERKHGRIKRENFLLESAPSGLSRVAGRSGEVHPPLPQQRGLTAAENNATVSPASKWFSAEKRGRSDLFFTGVVVLVNGYTRPDTDTLQRMLHRHGGDLERYETSRVTHIIAEHLSKAKANIYKSQRKPIPVCYPSWIVDCVSAKKLLPFANYLIDEVRDDTTKHPSIQSFFGKSNIFTPALESERPKDQAVLDEAVSYSTRGKASCTGTSDSGKCDVGASGSQTSTRVQETIIATTVNLADRKEVIKADDDTVESHNPSDRASMHAEDRKGEDGASKPRFDPSKTDEKFINGRVRTVGTDPTFLDSFFAASRLSFIGSYRQRAKVSPTKKIQRSNRRQQRYVFHVDMDCFFASVVLRKYPQYRNKPVAISHNAKITEDANVATVNATGSTSECATCNYVARSYGIKKGMYLGRAKELCPDLVVLQYDFTGYEEVSEQVAEIVSRYASEFDGNTEQVSCDEMYLELFIEGSERETAQCLAGRIGERIRLEIYDQTQCTASVGIAANKFLAKVASDRVKPNRSYVVVKYEDVLSDLKLRNIHGIGYRLSRKLETEGLVSVKDVWELEHEAKDQLCHLLGPTTGERLYNFCRGIDGRPVEAAQRKTIGAECNYGVRFNGPYDVNHMIRGLAKEVERRMVRIGVVGSRVCLKVKKRKLNAPPPPKFLGHGSCDNLSKSCDLPCSDGTHDQKLIADCCMNILKQMNVHQEDIRGMGIVVSKLGGPETGEKIRNRHENQSIVKFFDNQNAEEKDTKTRTSGGDPSTTIVRSKQVSTTSELNESERKLAQDSTICVLEQKLEARLSTDEDDSSVMELQPPPRDSPNDDDCDFEVPPASQIHLSQVAELPSPMRQHALAQIQNGRKSGGPGASIEANREHRFRQIDVRRMMKLAAIKSKDNTLTDELEKQISLTQLEKFPLEIQLQVANNDYMPVGAPCRRSSVVERSRASTPSAVSSRRNPALQAKQQSNESIKSTDNTVEDVSHQSIFVSDIQPLSLFLDENPVPCEESLSQVVQFLTVCAKEGRLSDVCILLRAVANRDDEWGGDSAREIVERFNRLVDEEATLDIDWILDSGLVGKRCCSKWT